jgi:hypothetical protein
MMPTITSTPSFSGLQDVANLTDVVMRLGMGWPMTLLDVAFRK